MRCNHVSIPLPTAGQDKILTMRIHRLANSELYMCIAAIVVRFDLELFETNEWDTEMAVDSQHHSPRLGSKGVQVFAKKSTF